MQEDVLVMDVGCACDVLWMYVMDYVCVLCDAKCVCAVLCIIYEFCVFASKESNKQTKSKFPSFAECQHWAKKALPSARGVALGKAGKKCYKNSHFPSFAVCHSLTLSKEVNFAECQMVPLGKDYFKKIFLKKMVSLPSVEPWLSAKIQILPSASP
jgi:hypothetical protein